MPATALPAGTACEVRLPAALGETVHSGDAVAVSLGRPVCASHLAADRRSTARTAGRGARAAAARRSSQVSR